MIPYYIESQYFVENGMTPVGVSDELSSTLNGIVRKIIRLYKKGIKIVLTNLDYIIDELDKEQEE